MYISEMHIEVNQGVQLIAANKTRDLLPEEIDWILNKVESRFIRSKITPKKDGSGGFEIDQLGVDALRTIIVTNKELTAWNTGNNRYASQLPPDYQYLLSDMSKVYKLCNGAKAVSTSTNYKYAVIPVRKSASTSPYYTELKLTLNTVEEFSIASYASSRGTTWTGRFDVDDYFLPYNSMISQLLSQGFELYHERWNDVYQYHSLIFVSTNPSTAAVLRVDGTNYTATVYTKALTNTVTDGAYSWETNRLTGSHILPNLITTPFYQTSADSPLSELSGDSLTVYADSSFIVGKTSINYIRKTRKMSVILNQDCELPENVHLEICDLAVEYIKAMIQDPNWEVKLKDNMIRTTL